MRDLVKNVYSAVSLTFTRRLKKMKNRKFFKMVGRWFLRNKIVLLFKNAKVEALIQRKINYSKKKQKLKLEEGVAT